MGENAVFDAPLRRVYWEVTAGCNLRCIHCRRTDVLAKGSPEELTTAQAMALVEQIAGMGRPVLILSGGEPVFRRDLLEIARHAKSRGLALGLATNGTLIQEGLARRLKDAGIYYASVSLDGARAATHDLFRGPGSFERAVRGLGRLKEAGIKVQVNFTVARHNVGEVEEAYRLAESLGACALYLFLLVPVGCGVEIALSQMLSGAEVDAWLRWVDQKDRPGGLPVKAICAPHYYRVRRERLGDAGAGSDPDARLGCLAGIHMCFISHKGEVFPCGYLPVSCGSVLDRPLKAIWEGSAVLAGLRDLLAEEPYCAYQPAGRGCGGDSPMPARS